MRFLEPITDLNGEDNEKNMKLFKEHIGSGKQGFLFLYMDGCGPCNATKLSWKEIPKHIKKQHLSNDNIVVAEINKNLFNEMENIGSEPMGFPTLRYIDKNGRVIEEYESSRTPQGFAEWIESKIPRHQKHEQIYTRKAPHYKHHHKYPQHRKTKHHYHKKVMRGGKWSMKYKKSINCKNPKGFSQRQHCKYGRRGWKTRKNL
uniref:Thioredoxin domain-containing protein n=1 Tax=viral metagenome TaxID=1070528 RepID=A0A6C0HC18_9ZZZZ